jgi:hypothetical protein
MRIGTLDEPPATLHPQAHIHVASKAPWWDITDKLPQHAAVEPDRG